MRHRDLLRRAIGVLAALALLLALPLQAGMAMPMPDHAKAAAMAMPHAEAAMPSCGCSEDGADMAMGACVALCGSMLALPSSLITLPTLPIDRPAATAVAGEPGWTGPPDPYPPRPVVLN